MRNPNPQIEFIEDLHSAAPKARTLAFTSGKGGVGKTCVSANLGVALARLGFRVCIFDADTGLANINILLNVRPQYTLEHLIKGERTIDQILHAGPDGLQIIPAASGIAACANLDGEKQRRLLAALAVLESSFDFLLIDTAAGAGDSVLSFLQSAEAVFLIITHEPTSLTDAFSLLKLYKESQPRNARVNVVVNLSVSFEASMNIFNLFRNVVDKYLGLEIRYAGFIPMDQKLMESVTLQQPVVIAHPDCPASLSFMKLAKSLRELAWSADESESFCSYWQKILAPAAETAPSPPPRDWRDILDQLRAPDYTEQQFREMLDCLSEAFLFKFATPYRSEPERKLALAESLVAELETRMDHMDEAMMELEKSRSAGKDGVRALSRLFAAGDGQEWMSENSRRAYVWLNRLKRRH